MRKINEFMHSKEMTPFLKWPGGKQWFVKHNLEIFPDRFNNYYEPFLGGGAVFFALQPPKAVLSDVNTELINLYACMRDNPQELKRIMEEHQKQHSKQYYYNIRECDYKTDLEKAGRFLYLNRTCFNGIYRVNRQGKFNVPIGTKNNCIYDLDMFEKYSEVLKKIDLISSDFMNVIKNAKEKDLIFADPPYAVRKNQNGFIKYNDQLFKWQDQERLFESLLAARQRGASIVLTNANCREIWEMYKSAGFFLRKISRNSSIAGDVSKRGKTTELLITSYQLRVNK